MKHKKQKWLVMEDDNHWKIVIPETDVKPHAEWDGASKSDLELAYTLCPCKPTVDWSNKMIVHNSFQDNDRIDSSMSNLK